MDRDQLASEKPANQDLHCTKIRISLNLAQPGVATFLLKTYIFAFRKQEPEFCGDLVYKLKKIVGSNNFSAQFIKIISHYKKIGYNINVLQQTACLVVNPITDGNFAFLFNCTPVGRTSDFMTVPTLRLIYQGAHP